MSEERVAVSSLTHLRDRFLELEEGGKLTRGQFAQQMGWSTSTEVQRSLGLYAALGTRIHLTIGREKAERMAEVLGVEL